MKILSILAIAALISSQAQAQDNNKFYNESAGQNIIYKDYKEFAPMAAPQASGDRSKASGSGSSEVYTQENLEKLKKANDNYKVEQRVDQKTGKVEEVKVEREKVQTDSYGNAVGNQFDLAVDGAFKGRTIAVLQFYGFDFSKPEEALKEKGFSVYRWSNGVPSPKELKEALKKSCQLWIISSNTQMLTPEHLAVIKEFFDSGKGLYIWGDNEPYYADANYIGAALLDIKMTGNLAGAQTVGLKDNDTKSGIRQNHLITTGMNYVYEGITIATVDENKHLTPLIWGSAGNLVTAVYEQDGRRAIFDGGFTRLYNGWDTAGTGRYVKNAAAWLANPEKFGEEWKE